MFIDLYYNNNSYYWKTTLENILYIATFINNKKMAAVYSSQVSEKQNKEGDKTIKPLDINK